MNINYCSPNFQFENRPPLKDYTSNVDNIKQAKNRIAELQNIIHELNKSNGKRSVSPLAKSPVKVNIPIEYHGTSKKQSPRFQTPETKTREIRIVSENVKMQTENILEQGILQGVLPENLIEKSIDNYILSKVLGLGSYAIVRLAQKGSQYCAIKTYEKAKINDQQKRKNVCREVKILSKLRHPNIIKFVVACETQVQLHVIMEYYSATSLNSFIKQQPQKKLDENEAKYIFIQIVDALRYCHHKSVVHRDLKLENILIDPLNNKIKIIDFGFSIAIDPSSRLNIFCGTPSYMAPEIVNKQTYSFPADVWALGILLFKMTTGQFPFRGNDDKDLYKSINSGKIEYPQYMSIQLRNLIKKILNTNQNERPPLKEVALDEWLQ
ncbi:unnamed protein product [Paramecium pentaurelia]|uniref:Protein kinase domain-containing protein n=1 Tax=Paramecium pentaurelia TaxID=43138 RepID=A0A8S1U1U4_9CILI|nr:unnamed protein product [Paramecium pentaurelia]